MPVTHRIGVQPISKALLMACSASSCTATMRNVSARARRRVATWESMVSAPGSYGCSPPCRTGPKELRLAGIGTVEAANAWLKSRYIAEHNARFAVDPEQEGSAFVPDAHELWREILCVVEERTVGKDNTVAWNGKRLQLPQSRLRPHFVKAQVRVHEYPDGTCAVFLGPHRLADYDAAGNCVVPAARKPDAALGAVKDKPCDKPCRARLRASLTAPARDA